MPALTSIFFLCRRALLPDSLLLFDFLGRATGGLLSFTTFDCSRLERPRARTVFPLHLPGLCDVYGRWISLFFLIQLRAVPRWYQCPPPPTCPPYLLYALYPLIGHVREVSFAAYRSVLLFTVQVYFFPCFCIF